MEKTKKLRPFGMIDKVGYAFGDLGCGLSFSLVSNYMLLFYTQVIGLSTGNWAWIVIVSKIWDAINDILIGNMVDRTRISKKSKFMPWIIIGAVGLVALNIMVFAPVQSFSQGGKIAWCLASYCLWSIAYTMANVPYGALHSVITGDARGRTALSIFRSIGAGVAMVFIMLIPNFIYTETKTDTGAPLQIFNGSRMFMVAIVFSIGSLIFLFATTKMVSERVPCGETAEKISYISTLKSFFSNRAMVGATLATFASIVFCNSTMSVNNLVFQYFFNDARKTTIASFASYIPFVLLMPFAGKLVASFGKKKIITITGIISTVAGIIMLLLPITPDSKGMYIYIGGLMAVNIGNGFFQIIVWAIVADCIGLSFRKSGVHEEGSLYAVYSFFRKLAQGVGSAIAALGLSAIGFVEGNGAVQSEAFGGKVEKLYIIFLTAGTAIMVLAMHFVYNITKKDEDDFASLDVLNEIEPGAIEE